MTGEALRAYRKNLDMKQEDLASALGVSRNTVARWERGEIGSPPYLALALKQIEADRKKPKK